MTTEYSYGNYGMREKILGLYFHIPFCRSKCAYCDFYSFVPSGEEIMERYVNALILHMQDYSDCAGDRVCDTVYIGGGTPSVLPTELLVRLIRAIKRNFNLSSEPEFTMEANPATLTPDMLKKLRRAGVNRLSIGLQSGDNRELRALSRIHTRADFEQSYRMARAAGFDNISVDLMFGIPGETKESLMRNLRYVTRLGVEHISLYDLKLEPGTPLFEHRSELSFPDEDTEADMYLDAVEYLNSEGYPQYEISNFSIPGRRSRHNLKYWNCYEYLGFGPGAHSYFNNVRYSYTRNIEAYIAGVENPMSDVPIIDQSEEIPARERIGEYVMLRLRLAGGVRFADFKYRFGADFEELFGRKLLPYLKSGFARRTENAVSLTAKGMFVSNYILSDILDFNNVGDTMFNGVR